MTVKILNHAAAPQFADGETASLAWRSADCHAFRTTVNPVASRDYGHLQPAGNPNNEATLSRN